MANKLVRFEKSYQFDDYSIVIPSKDGVIKPYRTARYPKGYLGEVPHWIFSTGMGQKALRSGGMQVLGTSSDKEIEKVMTNQERIAFEEQQQKEFESTLKTLYAQVTEKVNAEASEKGLDVKAKNKMLKEEKKTVEIALREEYEKAGYTPK